jgi:hypothetical protein
MYCLGMFIAVFPLQGLFDIYLWKRPFAELFQYIHINSTNYKDFSHGPWYNYLLLIGGMIIPPIGIFVLFGYFRSWKKYAILFWPSFIFLVFHSSFPNKQERFILPIVPFVLILGLIGWSDFISKSNFWIKRPNLMKYCWIFFWVLNFIALPVVSTTYSKKNRVEAMTVLGKQKDLHALIIEQSYDADYLLPPLFYLGKWHIHVIGITNNYSLVKAYLAFKNDTHEWIHPNYIVFFGKQDIDKRIAAFKQMFPHNEAVATIYPSFLDNVLEWLNPVNKNQTTFIYHFTEQDVRMPDTTAVHH